MVCLRRSPSPFSGYSVKRRTLWHDREVVPWVRVVHSSSMPWVEFYDLSGESPPGSRLRWGARQPFFDPNDTVFCCHCLRITGKHTLGRTRSWCHLCERAFWSDCVDLEWHRDHEGCGFDEAWMGRAPPPAMRRKSGRKRGFRTRSRSPRERRY